MMNLNTFSKKTYIAITTLVLAIGSLIWWGTATSPLEEEEGEEHEEVFIALTPEQISKADIVIQTASPGLIKKTVAIPAKILINENRHAHVVAKASGIVKEVNKNIGIPVEAGEVIATLESREMAEAKASYLAAFKREKLAANVLQAEENLKTKKISPEQDYFQALTAAEEAKINLELAIEHLHAMGVNNQEINSLSQGGTSSLCLYEMKSPITGTIIEKDIAIGELLDTNREAYTIANLNTLWIEMGVYPQDLPNIKIGQLVQIHSPKKEYTAEARISYLNPIVDDQSKTATAIAELNNADGKWYPGSYACARITTEETFVLTAVPKEAIQAIEGQKCLFVATEGGFEKRCITTGQEDQTYAEILSGLQNGEPYAATNTFLLKAELTKGEEGGDHH